MCCVSQNYSRTCIGSFAHTPWCAETKMHLLGLCCSKVTRGGSCVQSHCLTLSHKCCWCAELMGATACSAFMLSQTHAVTHSSQQVQAALLISTRVQYHYNTHAVFSNMSAISVVRLEDQGVGLVWCAGIIAATSHNVCCARQTQHVPCVATLVLSQVRWPQQCSVSRR